MGRVSCSQKASNVAATSASSWTLAATCFRWILAATASSRPFRLEFQHSSPPSGQGYWPPPPWAPPARGQAPPWGMPLWRTLTLQLQRHFSLPSTVSHLCLHSIVPFVIRANVERLTYSFIYVFKRPSSSVGCDFVDGVQNMGVSGEGEGGGTGNDAAP
jgi:hypothetical protein